MKKIKAEVLRYFNYKQGTMLIVLNGEEEIGVYVNKSDFMPLSGNVSIRKQKDSEYYELCPETREDTIALKAKYAKGLDED